MGMSRYIGVLKKYAVFDGRAQRAEFWWFALFWVVIYFVLAVIDASLGVYYDEESGFGLLSLIFGAATFLPLLGLEVRRLHDIGRSGVWLLINFVPVIGFIVFIIFMATGSQQGPNEYGEFPKATVA